MALPRRIGRYEVRARLASGATADVFLARAGDAPEVALKRLHPHLADDEDSIARLLDEARIAARLDHPAAIPVLDVGCEDGAWFVAFEHVAGADLAGVLERLSRRGERFPVPLAAAIVAELASVLSALHRLDEGLAHGDVSPANVLLSWDGTVRLGDLGTCAALSRGARGVFGTPGYVAPEQARGEGGSPAADVFAAGAVLFELLAGAPAYPHDPLSGLAAPAAGPPPSLGDARPEAGEALGAVVGRALAPDPRRRFATAEELEAALRPFAATPRTAREELAALLARLYEK